ncbi:hypothetical protein RclHR1_02540006 [Rhizophagus clarus]|uniref:Uncharacterized protein n=1 Tax=Rhizophagus clarus TaxID=94130 RepID=A0A2Z6R3Q6_9GLOM|nr:hypothetical protein RclHR1_02540006 [Rhizophagus clarus]GES82016.1 hypothetical protein GLOIN_2v1503450 [Rhizophagus clarus]
MTRYTSQLFPFTLIITFVFIIFTSIISAAEITSNCTIEGYVEFFPEYNKDSLSGVITFREEPEEEFKVSVDGIFTTDIGIDGIKNEDGNLRYKAELYDENEVFLYDLTNSVFNNAIELVTFEKQYIDLQICGSDSIINKVVVIKRDGEEIARAEIYKLLDYTYSDEEGYY